MIANLISILIKLIFQIEDKFSYTEGHKRLLLITYCLSGIIIFPTRHYLNFKHRSKNNYSCDLCDYKCNRKNRLMLHMATHGKVKSYSCQFCPMSFLDKGTKSNHEKTHLLEKTEEYIHKCEQCPFKAKTNYHLKQHNEKHEKKMITCHICSDLFLHRVPFISHLRKTHKMHLTEIESFSETRSEISTPDNDGNVNSIDETTLKCKFCNYKTKQKHNLMTHTRKKHENLDVDPQSCDICSKQLKNQHTLSRH